MSGNGNGVRNGWSQILKAVSWGIGGGFVGVILGIMFWTSYTGTITQAGVAKAHEMRIRAIENQLYDEHRDKTLLEKLPPR